MAQSLMDPHSVAEKLACWADDARSTGRVERADRLLMLAWQAYDMPARTPRVQSMRHYAMHLPTNVDHSAMHDEMLCM